MFKKIFVSLFLIVSLTIGVNLELQQGVSEYEGCQDSYVSSEQAGSNFGDSKSLDIKYEECTSWSSPVFYRTRAVLKFDLDGVLPDSAKVTKATLSLMPMKDQAFEDGNKTVYTLNDLWNEDDVTWSNVPKLGDVLQEFNVTEAVQDDTHVDGFIVKMDDYTTGIRYHSSESDSLEARPKLSIVYDLPTSIKHPITKVTKKPCTCMMVDVMGRRLRRTPANRLYFIVNGKRVIKRMDMVR